LTYSLSLLPIPRVVWEFIAHAMEQAGYGYEITQTVDGQLTVSVDMTGVAVIPEGDSDMCINSGRFSDLMVALGEEAFAAGFKAGMDYGAAHGNTSGNYYKSWSEYEPSPAISELESSL